MADIEIKIKIPSDKMDDLKHGFLKAVNRPEKYKHLTDLEFFKQFIKDTIFQAYKTGKVMIARETTTPEIDEDIVTEVS